MVPPAQSCTLPTFKGNMYIKAPELDLNPTVLFKNLSLVLVAQTNPNWEFVGFQNNLFL